jgi:hypothetical protein
MSVVFFLSHYLFLSVTYHHHILTPIQPHLSGGNKSSPKAENCISQQDPNPTSQIRTSEDILTLTRQMQELWLFGQLKTLDKNDIQGRIDADAKEVAEMLAVLVGSDKEENAMKIEG